MSGMKQGFSAILLVFLAFGHASAAELSDIPGDVVTPQAFRDYAEGYTLYFERDGEPWGAESFEEGGATVWRFPDGTCADGAWKAHGAQICFYYGEGSDVLCWRMFQDDRGMLARLLGDGPQSGMELRITGRDQRPLLCGEEALPTSAPNAPYRW
ncbi:MAG: hypothetical protein AAF713_02135 [Pseudomonadota bacterium]